MALKKVGAMWARKDKNGKEYFTLKMDNVNDGYLIFWRSKEKTNERQPDLEVFLRQDDLEQSGNPQQGGQDEIPF